MNWSILIAVVVSTFSEEISAIQHGTNLIWAQSPPYKFGSVSRLVAIHGDPDVWVAAKAPKIKFISAPHFTWDFRALGFHWADKTLFWSESYNKKIQGLVLNGSATTTTHFEGTSSKVFGLAVDWLSRNLYFTDALYNWIIMTSSKSTGPAAYKIVVQGDLDSPHGIAVHPQAGRLFWSDWGARPKIEASDLMGGGRVVLADEDMMTPRGLTIDYTRDLVYWVDTAKGTLEVMGLSGQGREVITEDTMSSCFGVALYKNFLFMTEKIKGQLRVLDQNETVVSFTLGSVPYDVIMYDQTQQPGESDACTRLGCSQMCVLDPEAGPQCVCGEGFTKGDDASRTCTQAQKFLHPSHIYAIGDSLCRYPANIADMSLDNVTLKSQCFLQDRQGYLTLTYDARDDMLYFFSNNTRKISRVALKAGGKAQVLTGGVGAVNGMALDWSSGNLYWTETKAGLIKVARKDGMFQRTLLEGLMQPWGIAVHPGRGRLYWTDHGQLPEYGAKIWTSALDGSDKRVLQEDDIGQPNHLYIDFAADALYWADGILHHVGRMDLGTGKVSVVLELDNVKFNGLTLFKDYLLWTDTDSLNGIHVARMDTKEKVRGIIHPNVGQASDLVTFDLNNQPEINNSCSPSHNICPQLCLLDEGGDAQCACGMGYWLAGDGFSCNTKMVLDQFLLVNDAYQRQIFQVNLKTAQVGVVDVKPVHEPIALAFEPKRFKVFWSDNKAHVIKQTGIDGKGEATVMYFNNASMVDGLACDYINQLLFYSDTGNDVIGVASMSDYSLFTTIVSEDLDQPRAVVVSPREGLIFWSDWGTMPKIERAYMDGSDRETVVGFNDTAWPNGLALDVADRKLYWVDAHSDQVSVVDLVTSEIRSLLKVDNAHFFSMDVVGAWLYVTDWKQNFLQRMPKKGGKLERFGDSKFTRLYGIKGFNSTEMFTGTSICQSSACDQLCLPRKGNLYTCACKDGFEADGIFCHKWVSTTTTTTAAATSNTSQDTTASNKLSPTQSSLTPSINSVEPSPTPEVTIPSSDNSSTFSSTSKNKPLPTDDTTNFIISSGTTEPSITEDPIFNSSSQASVSRKIGRGRIKPLHIVAIVVPIGLIAFAVVAYVTYRQRRHVYAFSHNRLLDEPSQDKFKVAAFKGQAEEVTFDSGIENPGYNVNDQPSPVGELTSSGTWDSM